LRTAGSCAVIEARDLRVHHPRGPLALDGVTVVAHGGEVVAIVGPNGSGKSTVLRVIAGFVAPHAGTVSLNHESIAGLPPHRRAARGIAYAPEHARILPGLSVRDNLVIGAWLRRDRRAVARDLDRIFDWFPTLREGRRRRAESLSYGDRQIVAFGRVLMAAPQVILLDEPFLGLDAGARVRLAAIVRMLRNDQIAILLAERDLSTARDTADRAYGLRSGRVVFSGSAAALQHSAQFKEVYD
jgi:branched-chain amino acid transport system ATP-binding protein